MLDAELAGVGQLAIFLLQGGDDAAALVAQGARLVERGVEAGADEAAVATVQRQVLVKRGRERGGQRGINGAGVARGPRQFVGKIGP